MTPSIQTLPELSVAVIRHVGPYAGDAKLFERLLGELAAWAAPLGLLTNPQFLTVYHNDPNTTPPDEQRMDVCLVIPADTEIEPNEFVTKQTLAGGEHIVARFELKCEGEDYQQAWMSIYEKFLPDSGYRPSKLPPFEMYRNNPNEHPEGLSIVDICVPVEKI